jgi:NAD(P)-dependent dehydrogenase (short-subunit alcohol dehydrogenase family)
MARLLWQKGTCTIMLKRFFLPLVIGAFLVVAFAFASRSSGHEERIDVGDVVQERELFELDVPPPLPQCGTGDPNYKSPHTTEEDIDRFFQTRLSGLGDSTEEILDRLGDPETVLCVGCSKGIGRANACYWGSRSGTKHILSLASTTDLSPSLCPNGGDSKIINVKYDIATMPKGSLTKLLKVKGISTIDLVLLSAVRDLMGPMRYWDANDIVSGFQNNVAGHHAVWREAREFFSREFAVVLAISSVAAETRFFSSRNFYHMTKQALVDLVLGYAIEEAYVQPNTHYAVVYMGDVGTKFGLKQINPSDTSSFCKAAFRLYGLFSNIYINQVGLDSNDLASFYHKIYGMIAGYKYLNETTSEFISRGDVPQSFTIEPNGTYTPLGNLQYNHRILPPGEVYDCYSEFWDQRKENFPLLPPFYNDPRTQPKLC